MEQRTLIEEVRAHYRSSHHSFRLEWGRTPALLVVDFIEGFTHPESSLCGHWDSQVEATGRLLEAVRESGLKVAFTTVQYSAAQARANLLARKTPGVVCLSSNSRWSRVDRRLQLEEHDLVISKQHGSAFFGTCLASQLTVLGIDTLLICGCVTSGCVRATAVDAAQFGFRPFVVREAVGDRSQLAHETNLMDIEMRYGEVVSLQEAILYIQGSQSPPAGRPEG